MSKPLFFKDYKLTLPGGEVSDECSSVALTPNVQLHEFKGGGDVPADYVDAEITWDLDVTLGQNWAAATSFGRQLLANMGTVLAGVEFEPKAGAGQSFTVDVLAVPASVGGQGRAHATSTVKLRVIGQPTFDAS